VLAVDSVPIDGHSVQAAIASLRGEPGTVPRHSVSRGPNEQIMEFSDTRAASHVDTVRSEYLGAGFGYVRLTGFSDSTISELNAAARELIGAAPDRSLSGLVLDLRNNPGGVLQAAIGVADVFLADGLIVRGNGRIRQARFEEYARPGDVLEQVPLAVLINGGSASGSEIVAGALQDHQRAALFGQRSFGKGSVQSVVPLGPGSALKLTTAHYLTPSGATINERGIDPDTVIELAGGSARLYGGAGSRVAIADDPQLRGALESLGYQAIALSQAR
jgi:carboxyl-terminal processing protease